MKIAVIISGLLFDSQKALMKGIERKIRDNGDSCYVFCCNGNVVGSDSFANGEFMIFSLPDITKFDGAIYVKNTFSNRNSEIPLIDKIRELRIPCVCIDCYDEDFVNINSDETGSLYALTEHMIKEHGCRDFAFLSGTAGGTDASRRYSGFIRALQDNDIVFDEALKFDGNYEYRSGVEATEYFLGLNRKIDCIVCSNDQMAVGVYMQLKKRGIKVPKDIKITGVDYDFVSRVISTRLTTAKRQQYQKGIKAIEILHNFDKYNAGDDIVLPIAISYGETCGCKAPEEKHSDVDDSLAVDRYEQAELNQAMKHMSENYMARRDYKSLVNEMRNYAYRMRPRELYLCLNVRPEVKLDYSDFSARMWETGNNMEYSDKMLNLISCIDGLPARSGDRFDRTDLLPPVAECGRVGVTYYFFPVHYINENFGYAVIGESGDLVRNDFFPNWVSSVSNAFENTRKLDLMEQMIETLDRMWIYDTLTGLYNRAGFFKLSEPIINECIREQKNICVIFLDVDGLKIVNDTYGHDSGDDLIKEVATVLKGVKRHGEIIMRYGGDEFVLLAAGYDKQQAEECMERIRKGLEEVNAAKKHPFSVEASIGYTITQIRNKEILGSIIEDADREMYIIKKKKKLRK